MLANVSNKQPGILGRMVSKFKSPGASHEKEVRDTAKLGCDSCEHHGMKLSDKLKKAARGVVGAVAGAGFVYMTSQLGGFALTAAAASGCGFIGGALGAMAGDKVGEAMKLDEREMISAHANGIVLGMATAVIGAAALSVTVPPVATALGMLAFGTVGAFLGTSEPNTLI